MFKGTVYLPGATLHIDDIGKANDFYSTRSHMIGGADPELSLACITLNVDDQCCHDFEERRAGWFNPDGDLVPENGMYFWWSVYVEQIRLNGRMGDFFHGIPTSGVYTCRVPDGRNSSVIHSANITLLYRGEFQS